MKKNKQAVVKKDASALILAAILAVIAASAALGYILLRGDISSDVMGERVAASLFVIENGGKPLGAYALFCYPATRRGALFDIPQDTGLIIRSLDRVGRIDSIYDSARPEIYRREVESLLGISIPYSLVMSMEGLRSVVDLLEGIELNIPENISDYNLKPPVLLPAGRVTLDGDKAESYFCYEGADETANETSERRAAFFLTLIKKIGEKQTDMGKPAVAKYFHDAIKTQVYQSTLLKLFETFAQIDSGRITRQTIGGNYREVSEERLLIPYYDGSLIKDIVRETVSGLLHPAESAAGGRLFTVEVLNGTSTAGLATRTAEFLRSFGYDVITVGNADGTQYDKTLVIDRSGEAAYGEGFASIIRCTNITVEAPAGALLESGAGMSEADIKYSADFTLILGWDFNGRYTN
jgi:hypothetical protein